MSRFRSLLLIVIALATVSSAHAQITVQIKINRRAHIAYEPVLATVTLANMSGRQLLLEDTQASQWFSFEIKGMDGRSVPPRNPNYSLEPLVLAPGETTKRTVNLNELYHLGDYGTFRVRANIYTGEANRFFSSQAEIIEMTEGRRIWQHTVGVPEGMERSGETRLYTLLTLEQDKGKMLYVRIEAPDEGKVYGCYNLGRLVEGIPPEMQFDLANNLWVLQLVGQKTYFLSKIGVNGEFHAQSTYVTPKSKPYFRKLEDGTLQLVGAVRQPREVPGDPAVQQGIPKLSDRPPGLPD